MARAAQGQAMGERPMLLFPEVRACRRPLDQHPQRRSQAWR